MFRRRDGGYERIVPRSMKRLVTLQFVFSGPTDEVEADYLVRSERRLAARPKADQQASDNGTVGLNLNAILLVTQQMPAAEEMLEEPKENLNGPSPRVNQSNGLGGNVQSIGGDP